ncbi:Pre-mRNA-splicing factor cwf18 [Colletotrichum trifolii]|uniref:Pre-mRNA-splicing factor cwf18 n=1 Tax=Colletotrichum trifolii TaxID=5466 RepID=A0A4R8RIH5_COLTR|nr:Pre-mRNA-splicing factor cwf18 [Colletotrichum trifolii]
MSSSQTSLSAAADDRKARLAKLKNLKRKQPADETVPPESDHVASPPREAAEVDVARLHLSGRNYDPDARGPKLGFEAPPTQDLDKPTLEELAADIEADVKQKAADEAKDDKGIDLFKLQPKKPNWDLKRDLEKKLEILNVRTDNAIARLVRERITNAQQAATSTKQVEAGDKDGDAAGMDGIALVEGLRVREREEEEDERREKEAEDDLAV